MSSAVIGFVHAIHMHVKKYLAQNVVRFGSAGPIFTIQGPFVEPT